MVIMLTLPTGRRGRVLALGLAGLALATSWFAVAQPMVGWYQARAGLLEQKHELAHRLDRLAAELPVLQRQADAVVQAGKAHEGLLQAPTDALAAAELQGMLTGMAREAGFAVSSSETLPAEVVAGSRRISVRFSGTGNWSAFVALLRTIERSSTSLLMDNVQIHGTAVRGRSDLPPIEATLTVSGFRPASDEAAGRDPVQGSKT